MYDVAIIGAGIIGVSVARALSRYELSIAVFEKENDVSMGATKANSAIVHGGFAESHAKVKGGLCFKGRKQFDQLDKELNFGYEKIGSLVLAFEEEQLETLKNLYENGLANGVDDLEIIDHDQIMAMEPNVNPDVKYALHCKGAGVCSPFEMAIALAENAVANGVELFLNTEIKAIKQSNVGFELVDTNDQIHKAKYVINAGGLQSAVISAMVGADYFQITPRTGEYMVMVRGSGSIINKVLFQMPTKLGKGILVTPTYHGNLLIGPDAVNQDTDDKSTHAERLLKIFNEAKHTTSKLNIKQFIRSFTGVRSISSTDDFIIEATGVKGFINCAGIQSPGLTSSPAIADMVLDILKNEGCFMVENPSFNPYRAPVITRTELKPMKEIQPLIDMESNPQKIICRCEQITEGTIIDAMNRGIPVTTIDGVKRRTRSGAGWCQGTFCRPRVAAVMEKELGYEIDPSFDIEHSGVNRVGKNEIVDYILKHEHE
ncbi:NAD(P)/FAD-dependent oxidoreductase [Acetobacterium bakii]|uniref:FAD-dependent oxidoreductase n=1 Tax=Acetobacterium bakii TaxID=52689 RepID=A0A0L6U188_9FIRM|nr:NAD(P)/FAD-dependent oxidoreductase [Acetobacterium bakii]KNZ42269.1 FAD-dependent oxidoreductase [Acetobacterium bakii]